MNKIHKLLVKRPSFLHQRYLKLSSKRAEEEIVVPDRIPRVPTDILTALASTVGTDYTGPHFKYHDDPWLIPYKASTKRDYTLAKEAGRNAAKFIRDKHPDLFHYNRILMEPCITAFQPKTRYNRDNVSVELLENLVNNFQVIDSLEVHSLLVEKGKEIPKDLQQDMLELVSFNNEEEAINDEHSETLGLLRGRGEWASGGVVEQLYSSCGGASSVRITLLLGLARYNLKERVLQIYGECVANNDSLPVEVYNAVLNSQDNSGGVDKAMESAKQILEEMKIKNISPNVDTLINILNIFDFTAAKEYKASCKLALSALAEFRLLGIDPSLGVYKVLIEVFVKKFHTDKSLILHDILREVEGKSFWPARSTEDFYFFNKAMMVCKDLNNSSLAMDLHKFLLTEDNIKMLGKSMQSDFYYKNFVEVVMKNEKLEITMELYNQLIPHVWAPSGNFYKELLREIHVGNGHNYIPKVYEDLRVTEFGGVKMEIRNELVKQLLEILVAHDPATSEFTGLTSTWLYIAKKSFADLVVSKNSQQFPLRSNSHASRICDLVIETCLREKDHDTGRNVMNFCMEEKTVMPSSLTEKSLTMMISSCIEMDDRETSLRVIDYAADMAMTETAMELGRKVCQGLDLTSDQKEHLNKVFVSETKWIAVE